MRYLMQVLIGLIFLTLFSLLFITNSFLGLRFINLKIKNNLRVDFSSEFVFVEMYYFGTYYGYASINFRELIIFFNTISRCNIHCESKIFCKVKNTKVDFIYYSFFN